MHFEKNSGPTKTQVFHKTQIRISKAQIKFTKSSGFRDFQILALYSLWYDRICKLDFLPEMGGLQLFFEQIQVRSKWKSGQLRKNSGQKSQNSGPKSKNSGFGVFPYLTKFKKVLHKKETWLNPYENQSPSAMLFNDENLQTVKSAQSPRPP